MAEENNPRCCKNGALPFGIIILHQTKLVYFGAESLVYFGAELVVHYALEYPIMEYFSRN